MINSRIQTANVVEAEWKGLRTWFIQDVNGYAVQFADPVSKRIYWIGRPEFGWHQPDKEAVEKHFEELKAWYK